MIKPTKDEPISLFARPLKTACEPAKGSGNGLSTFRPTSGLALAALMTLTCTVFLVQTRRDGAQNLVAAQKKSATAGKKQVRVALAERGPSTGSPTETARPALNF